MKMLERHYKKKGAKVPYYAKYSLGLLIWKPIRKYLNVVIIPNVPFNGLRIFLYRLIGFKIGKKSFIGMKCYLDDIDPANTVIGNNVTVSYGCYFAMHGKGQGRNKIEIQDGAYLGMRCNIIAREAKLIIGRKSIVGAASLVNKTVQDGATVVGTPARVIKARKDSDDNISESPAETSEQQAR
jgi:acetyltransferase-like isoleucine patch superfamily enzyme